MNTLPGVIIACDPGMDGGIVVLSPEGEIIEAHNMPTFTVQVPKKKRRPRKGAENKAPPKRPKKEKEFSEERHIDFLAIKKIFERFTPPVYSKKPEVYIENFTHLYGLPSSSNFKLGYAVGVLHGAVQSVVDSFYLVPVSKWHSVLIPSDMAFKADGSVDWGKTAKNAFSRLFPNYQGEHNSEGIRDAALIASYGLNGGL
jgi:hypothetical protein